MLRPICLQRFFINMRRWKSHSELMFDTILSNVKRKRKKTVLISSEDYLIAFASYHILLALRPISCKKLRIIIKLNKLIFPRVSKVKKSAHSETSSLIKFGRYSPYSPILMSVIIFFYISKTIKFTNGIEY